MTDWAPDYYRSRAVLIGTSNYTELTPVPAAAHSLQRMYGLLTGPLCGWPADRVEHFHNEPTPGDLPDRLVDLYQNVSDVAFFYYVGHGQPDLRDQLCLGLVGSRIQAERRATTSLTFDAVRHALTVSQARVKIVILDCCFAGLALQDDGALGEVDMMALTAGTGAFTVAASGAYNTAWFDTTLDNPAPHTYFTQHLAEIIEHGVIDGPATLTLDLLVRHLTERLSREGKPVPTHRARNSAAAWFPFALNAAPTEIIPAVLPDALRVALDSPYPIVRIGGVTILGEWLAGGDRSKVLTAEQELRRISETDSPQVADAARALVDGAAASEAMPQPQKSTAPKIDSFIHEEHIFTTHTNSPSHNAPFPAAIPSDAETPSPAATSPSVTTEDPAADAEAAPRNLRLLTATGERALIRHLTGLLVGLDLTPAQYGVLQALIQLRRASSATLALAVSVSPQAMVGLVAALERKGVITRENGRGAGRVIEAEVTDFGRKIYDLAKERFAALDESLRNAYGDEDYVHLVGAIERFHGTLANIEDASVLVEENDAEVVM